MMTLTLVVLVVLVVLAAAVTAVVLAANFKIDNKRHYSVPFLHAVTINIVTIKHSHYQTLSPLNVVTNKNSHFQKRLKPIVSQ
jgi:hypothetical protein